MAARKKTKTPERERETQPRRTKGVDAYIVSITPKDGDPVFYRGPDAKKMRAALADVKDAKHVEVELLSVSGDGETRGLTFNVDRDQLGDDVVDARIADLETWIAENAAADS